MRLDRVNYAHCRVGTQLVSHIGTPGIISRMLDQVRSMDGDYCPGFDIKWSHGGHSLVAHRDCAYIKLAHK